MTQIEKIKTEIERYISNYKGILNKIDKSSDDWVYSTLMLESKIDVLQHILSFLDTLEVKEINNVWHDTRRTIPEDGSEQIICIKEDGLAVSTVGKIVNGTIKWAYLGNLLDINSFNVGVKELDLEKKLDYNDYTSFFNEHPDYSNRDWGFDECWVFAKYFYELGLKAKDWEKERMEECPYRQVGCTMYEGKILECRGACSWVVDYLKLKELKAQKGE